MASAVIVDRPPSSRHDERSLTASLTIPELEQQLRNASDQVRAIELVTEAALVRLPLEELLHELLIRIGLILAGDTVAILLWKEEGHSLIVRAAVGLEEDVALGVLIPNGTGFAGRIAAERQPVVMDDIDDAEMYSPVLRQKGVRSLVGVPLLVDERVMGVLHVGTLVPRHFAAQDVQLLRLVADRAAVAIDRARLHHETQVSLRSKDDALALIDTLLASSPAGIAFLDRELRFLRVNESFAAIHNLTVAEHLGRTLQEALPQLAPALEPLLRRVLETGVPILDVEVPGMISAAPEARRYWLANYYPVVDGTNQLLGVGIIAAEITQRKALEEALAHQASHDPLTNLPNRTLFVEHLQRALARGIRHQRSIAVLFLDLDRFKIINDNLGHDFGDKLLIAFAARLTSCLRAEDIVARIGGDEFSILLDEVADITGATRVADRIASALQAPFALDGQEVFITASIGIASSGPAQPTKASRTQQGRANDLLRDADVAMYQAKAGGKSGYAIFEPSMHTRALERLNLEAELRWALERQEFRIHYQPVLQLATGQITGMEALVRWEHPRRGLLLPADFLPVAEDTGLIIPIGRWVLTEACRQARLWQAHYPSHASLLLCVNLSPCEFNRAHVVADVADVLDKTGLAPASLDLEITENAVMENGNAIVRTLQEFKSLGVQLTIDDFGTGYSSLSYLHRFPVDSLKIDRSFIGEPEQEPHGMPIAEAIVRLGHALHLRVTGEGVETPDQLARLRALGCDLAQGYYFARPLVSTAASALLEAAR